MNKKNKKAILKKIGAISITESIEKKYGKIGTPKRDSFEKRYKEHLTSKMK